MDAFLYTLTTELYQVNTRVGHITQWQPCLGGFVTSPFPSPKASKDEDVDDGFDDDDEEEDDGADSSSDEEMTASQWQKGEVVLGWE